MTRHFRLQVTRVECVHEQVYEWGKDELRLIAFGVSRKGTLFTSGYRVLGSYSEGDVRTTDPLPMVLFEADLPEDGLDAVLYLWLIEEDGSGVAGSAAEIDADFRAKYFEEAARLTEAGFPRECIPFTAFYKTMPSVAEAIAEAATHGRDDDVFLPVDLFLRYVPAGPSSLQTINEYSFTRSQRLGQYNVFLRAGYRSDPPVVA